MTVRVGINGFGRIGRQSLKAIMLRCPGVEVVAVNDLVDCELNALLFKHDSTYGAYPGTVEATADALIIDGREIKVLGMKDPAQLPWGDLGVDIVLESTGIFTDASKARAHLDAGATKVIISAPAKGEDVTVVLGVNEAAYDPDRHSIISERELHDQLPRADGEGRARPFRDQARAHEHDPLVHQRPARPRRRAQGSRVGRGPLRSTSSRRRPAPRRRSRSSSPT